jgi:hypothetical protein
MRIRQEYPLQLYVPNFFVRKRKLNAINEVIGVLGALGKQTGRRGWYQLSKIESLKDYIPSYAEGIQRLSKLVGLSNALIRRMKSGTSLTMPEPEERQKRIRLKYIDLPTKFLRLGPTIGKQLHLYLTVALPRGMRRFVERLLHVMNVWKFRYLEQWTIVMKEMSGVFKKYGEVLVDLSWWEYLINWELWQDFLPAVKPAVFKEEVISWVQKNIRHQLPDGSWDERFRSGVRKFLHVSIQPTQRTPVTFSDWIEDVSHWGRSGSTKYPVRVRTVGGTRAMKNKWATAWGYTGQVLYKDAMKLRPDELKVVQKRERGKVRGVIASGDSQYLRMSYVSYWLEDILRGHPQTTLFMSKKQRVEMWQRMCRFGHSVRIPIDQSHFDWQPTRRMINIVLSEITRLIMEEAGPWVDSLLPIMRDIIYTMNRLTYVDTGAGFVKYEKGILSGWRWTSLLDTVINAGEFNALWDWIKTEYGVEGEPYNINFQGDDIWTVLETYNQAILLAESYALTSFEVNPFKFFVSFRRDEYLRQVARSGIVKGMPARMLPSIFYRNPLGIPPPKGVIRLRESFDSWLKLFGRAKVNIPQFISVMIRDLSRDVGSTKDAINAWLGTPACLGGGGMWYGTGTWVEVKPGERVLREKIDASTIAHIPIYERIISLFTTYDHDEWAQEAASYCSWNPDMYTVRPGKISVIDRKVDLVTDHVSGLSSNLAPNWIVPDPVAKYLVRKLVRSRRYSDVGLLMDESSRTILRMLNRKSRRMLGAWIMGDVPAAAPVVPPFSPEFVSVIYEPMIKKAFGGFLYNLSGGGMGQWLEMAVGVESKCREVVWESDCIIAS